MILYVHNLYMLWCCVSMCILINVRGENMSELERLNVMIPADVKETLKEQAASKGLNLSAYVRLLLVAESKKKN